MWEKGGIITEDKCDMMIIVVPNQFFAEKSKSSRWILFPLYD